MTIAKKDLKHGAYYKGTCRNADTARWNSQTQRFVYIRHKFGGSFSEDIKHPDDEQRWDVFIAESETAPTDPEIPLTAD